MRRDDARDSLRQAGTLNSARGVFLSLLPHRLPAGDAGFGRPLAETERRLRLVS